MNLMTVICEYNPFHSGHSYQLNTQKEAVCADAVIGIMSGSFVQRGEPAMFDKWARTEMALSGGCDLVLELPVVYSLQSAEGFARGAVATLSALGIQGHLAFGSECGDAAFLSRLAEICFEKSYKTALQAALSDGESYAHACQIAFSTVLNHDNLISISSNDVLGVEYCKAIKQTGAKLVPSTITRIGAHDSDVPEGTYLSASGIRNRIKTGVAYEAFLSSEVKTIINREFSEGRGPVTADALLPLIRYAVRNKNASELAQISGVSEGLENRIIHAVADAKSFDELIEKIKTKRYTQARLQRALINILLRITKEDEKLSPGYARILGFNDRGSQVLRQFKETSGIPLITKTADANLESDDAKRLFALDLAATDLYSMLYPNKEAGRFGMDFYRSPIKKP